MYSMKLKTGLTGEVAKAICDSVIDHMKVGYWKNTESYDKYKHFISVKMAKDGEVFLKLNTDIGIRVGKRYVDNGFRFMGNGEILSFFSNKVKFILSKDFAKSYGMKLSELSYKKADSMRVTWLADCDNDITVKDVRDVIRALDAAAISAMVVESSYD